MIIGDSAVTAEGLGRFTAVATGTCELLSIERRKDGIFVSADLYDREGDAVVGIRDNRIAALNGETYSARQSNNESALTVKNARGTELFYLHYLNPRTVQFRGFLRCPGGPPVQIHEGQRIAGILASMCIANSRYGIVLN